MQPLFAASSHEGRLRSRLGPTPGSVGPSRGVAEVASVRSRGFRPHASDVCIMRGSPLGNPFPMECGDSRCVVCNAFEALLASGESLATSRGASSSTRRRARTSAARVVASGCSATSMNASSRARASALCAHVCTLAGGATGTPSPTASTTRPAARTRLAAAGRRPRRARRT